MIPNTIAFVTGVVLLQWQPSLLPVPYLLILFLSVLLSWRFPLLRPPACLLLGFLWASLDAHWAVRTELQPALEGPNLHAIGVIASLPDVNSERIKFEFFIEQLSLDGEVYKSPGLVRLSWYRRWPDLQVGDRWQLLLRLKRPHGLMNPGGFDYEGWLFQRGIRATGYVRSSSLNRRLGETGPGYLLDRWRAGIRQMIDQALGDTRGAGLLRALVIGDRTGIDTEEWSVFQRTGTNHLIAISGLHIGIVTGLMLLLGQFGWRLSGKLCLLFPASRAAAVLALLSAIVYTGLAGFAIPATRALIMLLVLLVGVLLARATRPFNGLCMALLAVVILDPVAVLSPGFWLSFCAVGVILVGLDGRVVLKRNAFYSLVKVQWLVTLGLAPILLAWGFGVSPLAPIVNLIAVPVFSLFLVPLVLLATFISLLSAEIGFPLLRFSGWLLEHGVHALTLVAEIPVDMLTTNELPAWIWALAMIGVALCLLPRGMPGRLVGVVLMVPLMITDKQIPETGEVWFTLLDVGQGLSAVVRTRDHTLVYDAGPRFASGFDAGKAVLLPFLKQQGVTRVDKVILSNGDMDHRGGFASLVREISVGTVLSGEPEKIEADDVEPCIAGLRWHWDGVDFKVIHPESNTDWTGNNTSCVLVVESNGGRLLLTGDIESEVEVDLLAGDPVQLKADMALIPHHGSMSSSTVGFIEAVSPDFALSSAGYGNRYGFPRDRVVRRWQAKGAEVFNTAGQGALMVKLNRDGSLSRPKGFRIQARRYWMKTVSETINE